MSFKERLESGKFVTLAELQPPTGNHLSELFEQAERLKGKVAAISVPDLQNEIMRLGSLPVCALLKAKGIETIFNLSCSDRNRLALQSELLNASAFGLDNVLILQGESPGLGDHFDAKAVFDLDLPGLLGAAKRLQEGYDMAGNELKGKPRFCMGTQMPLKANGQDMDLELREMEKKVALGACFFIVSSVYDVSRFERFMKKAASLRVPVIAGVALLKSVGMARYINKNVEGASIPETIIDRLMKAPNKQLVSIEIAKETVRQLRPLCQGVEIVPMGWEHLLPAVLE